MVCGNDHCPQKGGVCVDHKLLNECVLWEVHPLPKVNNTLASRPQPRGSPNSTLPAGLATMYPPHYIHYPVWLTVLQQAFIQNIKCTRALSKKHEQDPWMIRRSSVPDGQCPDLTMSWFDNVLIWQRQRRAWHLPSSHPKVASRSNIQPWEMCSQN